ncbi:hypothetical protein SAMN05216359_103161 [Roseateles sp. YR242]|uniref:hypothetical protein n=1 Tax=Roseateles sp. YR242 TaxID=1855305 RepID=UPI0008AC7419|nr:hypothetical protein [Roseateles sp. YR242]SEK80809.1 hypothetical protein SAMN05216359_103161 [Roseateles sp. YR242]
MAHVLDSCVLWVVEYRLDGRPRRWIRALPVVSPPHAMMLEELDELYGTRAALVDLRQASDEERVAFIRGEPPPVRAASGDQPTCS